jgi:hypothetical protein
MGTSRLGWVLLLATEEEEENVNDIDTRERVRGGRLRMRRSRGAASGFLLILLGVWGAAVPFIGPHYDFAFSPGQDWSAARGWLEVLPGAATVLGGLFLLMSRNRAAAMLGGWLSVIAGAWFVVGRVLAGPLGLGDVGTPVASSDTQRVWLELSYFYGLGALIVFLGAFALGRVSLRTVRDVNYAQRSSLDREPVTAPTAEITDDDAPRRSGGWRNRVSMFGHRHTHAH